MDELFLSPSTPVAMPRVYWLDKLSSAVVVLEPSLVEWNRIDSYAQNTSQPGRGFDMDILSTLYNLTYLALPQCPYLLLSSEFGEPEHAGYLGADETWDPTKVLAESKYVHFSGIGIPKPWLKQEADMLTEY